MKRFRLKEWKLQNSVELTTADEQITQPEFNTNLWYEAKVPCTVLGTLVENKVIKDPFFGKNLTKLEKEPYLYPWWYRTEFELSEEQARQYAALDFDGINYRADIWLNGQQIASKETVFGAFRRFTFDISDKIRNGKNLLAVKVFPPVPGDFSIGFVDWNPASPDGNMGLFRPVTLRLHGGVAIENPFIQTEVNLKTLKEARLIVSAELVNYTGQTVSGNLRGKIESIEFSRSVSITAGSKDIITFLPEDFSDLCIQNPRLWWPLNMGEPEQYDLELQFQVKKRVSDTTEVRFGIRKIEDYLLNKIHRGYKVNGQKVLIKGGGWADDLFLMNNEENLEAQVKYVKHMNLNCIRLEGIWGKDHKLYDLCDAHGILMMVGWSCHWEHELHLGVPVDERFGGVYKPEHIELISQSWQDQVIWLRNHPSIFVWTVASDKVPITLLEQKYIDTFTRYDPTRPYLNSTGGVGSEQHIIGSEDVISDISGSSGVKMLGPYDYTPPVYWFTDKNLGGAYGFNTETGPGAQIPPLESVKKMIPNNHLWPIDEVWDFHCAKYEFSSLSRFKEALNERYGKPKTLEEFDIKSQVLNYELMRPMFEAFRVNKNRATGVIQWMLNAAWPKMYWQLYDYYLMSNGAFYGTKKACQPLNLVYNYGDNQVYLINDYLHMAENLQARIRIYDVQSNLLYDETKSVMAAPDISTPIFKIPELKNLTETYFLDSRLLDEHGTIISINFYWLSAKADVLDYDANIGDFGFYTPSKEYADLTQLNTLPKAGLKVEHRIEQVGNNQKIWVDLANPGNKIAFFINLKIIHRNNGDVVLPIFWEDNYLSLLPGERRSISAIFKSDDKVELIVSGWNT